MKKHGPADSRGSADVDREAPGKPADHIWAPLQWALPPDQREPKVVDPREQLADLPP